MPVIVDNIKINLSRQLELMLIRHKSFRSYLICLEVYVSLVRHNRWIGFSSHCGESRPKKGDKPRVIILPVTVQIFIDGGIYR